MATKQIVMDYDLMDEAIHAYKDASSLLEDFISEAGHIASGLEDGILLGRTGDAFAEAVRAQMNPAVGRLRDKLNEMAQDMQRHVDEMRRLEEENKKLFN